MNKRRRSVDYNDGVDDILTAPSISPIDNELIVCEILSRLPVKSLMRFKCVSKHWLSIIDQDQHFVYLHLSRSKTPTRLLITGPLDGGGFGVLSADLFEGGEAVVLRKYESSLFCKLNCGNGLSYFEYKDGIRICNLSTQEMTPLLRTNLSIGQEDNSVDQTNGVDQRNVYHQFWVIGFNPINKEHKVIGFWQIHRYQDFILTAIDHVCEVMTIGNNTWRTMDDIPPYRVWKEYVCVNGTIYWIPVRPHPGKIIVALDVDSEKFRVIPIPSFISDPTYEFVSPYGFFGLLEVDGCLAILDKRRKINESTIKTFKMWIFNDKGEGTSSDNWTEETITFQSFDSKQKGYTFQTVAGTDLIITSEWTHSNIERDSFSIYYYDRKKKTTKEVEITGIFSSLGQIAKGNPHLIQITTFTESLLPVQKHSNNAITTLGFLPVGK